MSSTFTPSSAIDMSKERDWPANLGMLDWDNTSIVFTKRTLIEFLKYTGTTVDTNFNNISKLPRYAKFGKLSEGQAVSGDNAPLASASFAAGDFLPSRRVREPPGGARSDIFAPEVDDDALAMAPPQAGGGQIHQSSNSGPSNASREEEDDQQGIDFGARFKPTRRVREAPGGKSNLSNFWDDADEKPVEAPSGKKEMSNFWDAEENPTGFKPTRRVTQTPGGQSNVEDFF